jgi:hypothetical protein
MEGILPHSYPAGYARGVAGFSVRVTPEVWARGGGGAGRGVAVHEVAWGAQDPIHKSCGFFSECRA